MSGTLSQGPGGGIVPPGSGSAVNPLTGGMMQRYASMPTETLQEMAARGGNSQQGQMAQRMLQQRLLMPNAQQPMPSAAPMPQAAPVASTAPAGGNTAQPSTGIQQTPQATSAGVTMPPTTNAMKRGGGIAKQHFDLGGVPAGEQTPWYTRREASDSGLIHAYSPGRTDTLNMEPLAGSYIFPADVISGLGEGNTLAGASAMDRMLSSGPHGIPMPRGEHGRGPPAPPRAPSIQYESAGGAPEGQGRVPIVAAGGEYKVSPQQVAAIGGGDLKRGHDILDRFVLEIRQRTIKDMKKLPPPKKK